jgi:large subunit ribosomal protein L32e
MQKLLELRKKRKQRMPKFRRQKWSLLKRVGEKWRRPRGRGSKMRLGKKGKPPTVKIGYKLPEHARGIHPSGLAEVLVRNPAEAEKLDPTKQVIRIAASVGKRKREQILARAKERGIRVLNP